MESTGYVKGERFKSSLPDQCFKIDLILLKTLVQNSDEHSAKFVVLQSRPISSTAYVDLWP